MSKQLTRHRIGLCHESGPRLPDPTTGQDRAARERPRLEYDEGYEKDEMTSQTDETTTTITTARSLG